MSGIADLARASLDELLAWIAERRARGEAIELLVMDPDRGFARGLEPGERDPEDGAIYRPWHAWIELADRLGLRMQTPQVHGARVAIRYAERAAPARADEHAEERYGDGSAFARVRKLEDPGFAIDLDEALARVGLAAGARVLELGPGRGDVLARIAARVPDATLVGVDHSASAIALARAAVPHATLHVGDARDLRPLLGDARFDLAIAIGVLQSGALDDRAVLRALVQDHLAPGGAVILGVPNSRWIAGELAYGARMKNFRQPELGLAIKDVAFYRKYLQQHHRQVFVTGRHYWFVTAVAIG